MIKKQHLNKLDMLEKEALNNLTQNQKTILMKKVTEDFLKDYDLESKDKFDDLRDYFLNQDIYTSYNALHGISQGLDSKRISLEMELELLNINHYLELVDMLVIDFNTNFKILEACLIKIYNHSDDSERVKDLNRFIKHIYICLWSVKEESIVNILTENKEFLEEKQKYRKEFLNKYKEITVKDGIIEKFDLYFESLFDNIEKYNENLKKFNALSEDGFVFLKKEYPIFDKSNLVYDFSEFNIKEMVNNESQ